MQYSHHGAILSNWILYIIQDNLLFNEHFFVIFQLIRALHYNTTDQESHQQSRKSWQIINYRVCDGKIYYNDASRFLPK